MSPARSKRRDVVWPPDLKTWWLIYMGFAEGLLVSSVFRTLIHGTKSKACGVKPETAPEWGRFGEWNFCPFPVKQIIWAHTFRSLFLFPSQLNPRWRVLFSSVNCSRASVVFDALEVCGRCWYVSGPFTTLRDNLNKTDWTCCYLLVVFFVWVNTPCLEWKSFFTHTISISIEDASAVRSRWEWDDEPKTTRLYPEAILIPWRWLIRLPALLSFKDEPFRHMTGDQRRQQHSCACDLNLVPTC